MVGVTKVSLATRYLPLHIFLKPMGLSEELDLYCEPVLTVATLRRDNGHHEDNEKEEIKENFATSRRKN
jgi:hypothetical protein